MRFFISLLGVELDLHVVEYIKAVSKNSIAFEWSIVYIMVKVDKGDVGSWVEDFDKGWSLIILLIHGQL